MDTHRRLIIAASASRITHIGVYAMLVVPLLASMWLIYAYGVNVPFWDEWDMVVPIVAKAREGTLTFHDLIQPHNEHRIPFPRLIALVNSYVTHFDRRAEMYLTVFLLAFGTFVTYRLNHVSWKAGVRGAALCIPLAWLLLGWHQWESLLMGVQTQYSLLVACTLSTVWLLSRVSSVGGCLYAALGSALVATYSLASGLLVWPLGFAQLLLSSSTNTHKFSRWYRRPEVIWAAVAAAVWISYLTTYQPAPDNPDHPRGVSYIVAHLSTALQFTLVALGSPIANTVASAMSVGFAMLCFCLYVAIMAVRAPREERVVIAPWLMLIVLYFLSIGTILTGRLSFGPQYALSSRYNSIYNLGWVGLYSVIVYFSLSRRSAHWIALGGIISLMVCGMITCTLSAVPHIQGVADSRRVGQYGVKIYEDASDDLLLRVYPSADRVRELAPILRRYRLSVFAKCGEEAPPEARPKGMRR